MKFDKNEFLGTEFGEDMIRCITAWDVAAGRYSDPATKGEELQDALDTATWCRGQWKVFQLALKQFYGVACWFISTDECFGIVLEDEADWLYRRDRRKHGQGPQ